MAQSSQDPFPPLLHPSAAYHALATTENSSATRSLKKKKNAIREEEEKGGEWKAEAEGKGGPSLRSVFYDRIDYPRVCTWVSWPTNACQGLYPSPPLPLREDLVTFLPLSLSLYPPIPPPAWLWGGGGARLNPRFERGTRNSPTFVGDVAESRHWNWMLTSGWYFFSSPRREPRFRACRLSRAGPGLMGRS